MPSNAKFGLKFSATSVFIGSLIGLFSLCGLQVEHDADAGALKVFIDALHSV